MCKRFLKLPKLIRFLSILAFSELVLFTIFRIAFFIGFHKYASAYTSNEIFYSFWTGFRFDIQLIVIINAPIFLFGGIKYLGIFKSTFGKYFWLSYILLSNIIIVVLYVVNFAYYDFFKKLVDNTLITFLYDFGEAFKMAQEGYPVNSAIVIAILFFAFVFFSLHKLFKYTNKDDTIISTKKKISIYSIFILIFTFAGYGKTELYPWRWSEAFWSSNSFLSSLSSNPITYFTNTLKNKDAKYDEKAAKRFYPFIADFLEVPNKDLSHLSLVRVVTPNHPPQYKTNKPNIIFILGESTAYTRTSMSGNPLNPTPNLNEMAKAGITHTMYFTPHSGTARSVWTAMTGMTDVERMKTGSRNPMTVEQNMILNSLKDYKKFYFIGGSLSWGNVRGVIGNVDKLITREEASYESPRNDVWGISDAHLVGEAHKVLKETNEPFFAFIQLAGNHSPNTIPNENFGFKMPPKIDKDTLLKHSFDGSQNEYEGQMFLDHSVGRLIKLAKQEKYFDNTIFIFVGDHGLPRRGDHIHKADMVYGSATLHTPLIIYAPKLLKHEVVTFPVSEVDIMATIAGLSGEKYINSTFGRDILDNNFSQKPHYAFFMTHEENPTINLIGEKYIFQVRANGTDKRLFEYFFDKENDNLVKKYPQIAKEMEDICRGIYENTRYTRYHNSTMDVENRLKELKTKK
jgi:phosphoglycerol transferase MdoB-like AlkP superfamily enzyme